MSKRGWTVLSLDAVEDVCEQKRTTLVIHPVIRRAVKGYEESFYIGLRSFLSGDADGIYFLPLRTGDYVRLVFSRRTSPGGYSILRIDPLTKDGLSRIRDSLGESRVR
jgi:hypothetical protein